MKVVLLLTRAKYTRSGPTEVFLPCYRGHPAPTLDGVSFELHDSTTVTVKEQVIAFAWTCMGVEIEEKKLKLLGEEPGKWVVYAARLTNQQVPIMINLVSDWDGWVELQAVFDSQFDPDIFPFIRMLQRGGRWPSYPPPLTFGDITAAINANPECRTLVLTEARNQDYVFDIHGCQAGSTMITGVRLVAAPHRMPPKYINNRYTLVARTVSRPKGDQPASGLLVEFGTWRTPRIVTFEVR